MGAIEREFLTLSIEAVYWLGYGYMKHLSQTYISAVACQLHMVFGSPEQQSGLSN